MKRSAGILLFRLRDGSCEVLIVHPGGPFWSSRDAGAWSIPKGEFELGEPPECAARREFAEELGMPVPAGELVLLGEFKQPSGKIVTCFALEADLDVKGFKSNMFGLEWPPRSGKVAVYPEVDLARWYSVDAARSKLLRGQRAILEALRDVLPDDESSPKR